MKRWIAAGLLVAVGAGAGSYLVGRASINQDAVREAGYASGLGAGKASGQAAGYNEGRADGYRDGVADGKRRAAKQIRRARQNSFGEGYQAAFAGFPGWHPGDYYIVKIGTAPADLRYEIDSRISMDTAHVYDLCSDGNGICGDSIDELVAALSAPLPALSPVTVLSAPTIPNFENGRGYPVLCSDGTISGSGGIQGACSHHGGESP